MSGIKNFGDKRNTNGFDKRPEDTTKGGRPPSFKTRYKNALKNNNGVIWISNNETLERIKDGKKEIGFNIKTLIK